MAFKDTARFYKIDGRELPSVTTILQVINKPALGPWYAKMERQAFETAMLDVLARGDVVTLESVIAAVAGVKAGEKERDAAADVGTAAHAMIEWLTRKMLGEDPGPEPVIPDAAMIAVEAWRDWMRDVGFKPLHIEPVVHHAQYGYAGRADVIGEVARVTSLVDYKSSKAVYAEAHLQITAYRHAAASMGLPTDAGLILRLPKSLTDPAFEAVSIPDAPLDDFLAAMRLWQWQRRMASQPTGS